VSLFSRALSCLLPEKWYFQGSIGVVWRIDNHGFGVWSGEREDEDFRMLFILKQQEYLPLHALEVSISAIMSAWLVQYTVSLVPLSYGSETDQHNFSILNLRLASDMVSSERVLVFLLEQLRPCCLNISI